jgi:hypothetical protein
MQGTSLEEVFGTFQSSGTSFSTPNPFPILYGLRGAPSCGEDLSGSVFMDITKAQQFQSLTETPPQLDPNSVQLGFIVDAYRNLKQYSAYIMQELETTEKNIRHLEDAKRKFLAALETYTSEILRNGILSKEEFDTLQAKRTELQTFQQDASEKCLQQYKEQALSLSKKQSVAQMNLESYVHFLKAGTAEMAGPNVKQNSCPVCYESEITHCLVPCGHTFCDGCLSKSDSQRCAACRTPFQSKVKLFF